ncbi:unnamed protein product [Strongylus vulgaris]|uniref:Receptor L-domain domain-containing protein n=1 Tax=Strongylus vulgaris TaxID=40348 RepID=A0A3P7K992_STRVU|nr:unnamed protein product [Strongylus vulgaris]
MQVDNRLFPCILLLLCGRAAALSDEECANYHELRSLSDYEIFVEDCSGKTVLGFDEGVSNKFYASNLDQDGFNELFAKAEEVSFAIYIENTNFVDLKMPKLRKLKGGLSIRNNAQLKRFYINGGFSYDRSTTSPTTVTVDGNPVLSQESMDGLRQLCSFCDIFKWTKCSALEQVTEDDYAELVNKCAGERIIKQKPGARFYLNANKLSQSQFNALFSQATHVQMCINFHDMQWKQITFPRVVRLIPCGYGDPSIDVVHNYYLTAINLPSYNSEGFGRLNPMMNVVLKNNFVLSPDLITSFKANCRFCRLLQYKECDSIAAIKTRNATEFVDLCGGKRIMWPKKDNVLILDISKLEQKLIDELFADVTKMKMCIVLRGSQIKHLRMPNLKELYACKPGSPAFIIENNQYLEEIIVSPNLQLQEEYLFVIVGNRRLPYESYHPFERCKHCVIERETVCGLEKSGYQSVEELMSNCMGKQKIVFTKEIVVNEYQFEQLCRNAVHLKMCINIINTDYKKISCPYLRYIEPCQRGKSVFTIMENPYLIDVDIPETVTYPADAKILRVKKNMRLPMIVIEKLKKICPHCEIEGYASSKLH